MNRTRWIGRNPTWYWNASQINQVLGDITARWSVLLGRPSYKPPPVLPSRSQSVKDVRALKREERIAYIFSKPRPFQAWAEPSVETEYSERGLYAGVIRRAFLDYACGVVSPLSGDQRQAINAYWWINNHPFLLTQKVLDNPDDGIPGIICGEVSKWSTTPSSLYEEVDISAERLIRPTASDVPYYPQGPGTAPFEVIGNQSYMTFESCCEICGVDARAARMWLHLVRPDETPTARHERHVEEIKPLDAETVDHLLDVRINGIRVTTGHCPTCGVKAKGVVQVSELFGFRRTKVVSGNTVYRRQSYCRSCRAKHVPKKQAGEP